MKIGKQGCEQNRTRGLPDYYASQQCNNKEVYITHHISDAITLILNDHSAVKVMSCVALRLAFPDSDLMWRWASLGTYVDLFAGETTDIKRIK